MKSCFRISIFILGLLVFFCSCKKDNSSNPPTPPPNSNFELSYGDSVFYLNNQSSDYLVNPVETKAGVFSGFPDGLDIDSKTGQINVTKSETGLRYRVSFVPEGTTDSFFTTLVISGINFLDGFYRLNTADSILKPIYNAGQANAIPGINNGTIFDDGAGCNTAGCNVNTVLGSINLAQTVRNGVFGATPTNNDRHEFDLNYRINDNSGKTLNTIRVKLYYFDSINDVTPEVYDIISSREGSILGFQPKQVPFHELISVNSIGGTDLLGKSLAQPRPPCIFILAR
jgi:hypothetical protein